MGVYPLLIDLPNACQLINSAQLAIVKLRK